MFFFLSLSDHVNPNTTCLRTPNPGQLAHPEIYLDSGRIGTVGCKSGSSHRGERAGQTFDAPRDGGIGFLQLDDLAAAAAFWFCAYLR